VSDEQAWLTREAVEEVLAAVEDFRNVLRDKAHDAFGDHLRMRRDAFLEACFDSDGLRDRVEAVMGRPAPEDLERPELGGEPPQQWPLVNTQRGTFPVSAAHQPNSRSPWKPPAGLHRSST
jgi:hypothetical protein